MFHPDYRLPLPGGSTLHPEDRMRSRVIPALALVCLAGIQPVQAQSAAQVTVELIDRFLTAYETEKSETAGVESQITELDSKIKEFQSCKEAFELAAEASGSKLGGMAAKIAMKAKCGATNDDGFLKERAKLLEGPEKAAAKAGGFSRVAEYAGLKERFASYLRGVHAGYSQAEMDALKSRSSRLSSLFGITAAPAGALGYGGGDARGGGRGARGPNLWTQDYAWEFIGQLFAITYISGATVFEKAYEPGQWTRWEIKEADMPDESQVFERAFLFRNPEGAEWWRLKTINNYKDGDGNAAADTVALEALFKPLDPEGHMKQLVRMRGKLPGSAEAQELMVPMHMSMLSLASAFPFKPTPESIEGATVGIESLTTPAGTFKARRVRFGSSGGTIEWWLDESAAGGWVQFQANGEEKEDAYTMRLIGHGNGAKSELGAK